MKILSVDRYVVETLMPDLVGHDRQPAAFLVFLYLWMETRGRRVPELQVSLREIAECTGLSKRSVQSAITRLRARRLVSVRRASATAVPVYRVNRPWRSRK